MCNIKSMAEAYNLKRQQETFAYLNDIKSDSKTREEYIESILEKFKCSEHEAGFWVDMWLGDQ